MRSRLTLLVVAAVAILLLGGVCGPRLHPPEFVSVPHSVHAGETAWVRLATSGSGYGAVRYVVNWGDTVTDTTGQFRLLDTATVWHVWTTLDTQYVSAAVYPIDDPQRIKWAVQRPILVEAGGTHAPVVDTVEAPPLVMRGVEVYLTVRASDPDGDSIKVRVDWGDGQDTTSEYRHGPYYFGFYPTHTFTKVETARVLVTVQDWRGAMSLPDTTLVRVDTTGGVIWSSGAPWASPLVVNDGVEDCVYFMPVGGLDPPGPRFSALTKDGSHKYTAPSESFPSAGVAYCAASQHIVGRGRGLWALDRQLRVAWRCETPESSGWGDPAVRRDRIYLGNDNDTLYCFIDSVDHGVRAAAFATRGAIVDVPIVDAQGYVYVGTDSGLLYKVGSELDTVLWCIQPVASGGIHSPVIGADGTVYCASESQSICVIDPATGNRLWTTALTGQPSRLVLGRAAIFVGTTAGKAYSIDLGTGGVNWTEALSQPDGFSTAPAVAADGSVYFQNDGDVLYRVNQADGTVVWQCDCSSYYWAYASVTYPGKLERPTKYPPNPTILPDGNIIVAGAYGLYCVAGTSQGQLDPLAPWPKWQHDRYNTGFVSGGR